MRGRLCWERVGWGVRGRECKAEGAGVGAQAGGAGQGVLGQGLCSCAGCSEGTLRPVGAWAELCAWLLTMWETTDRRAQAPSCVLCVLSTQ